MEIYFSPDIGEVFGRYSSPGIGEVLKLNLFRLEMGNMLGTFSAGGCTLEAIRKSPCRHSSVVISLFLWHGVSF